jgi:hypothetical protein
MKKLNKKRKSVVKINDERKIFVISTNTVVRYLCDRRRYLEDNWLLIAARYNCGVGNVWKAMEPKK